MLSTLAQDVRFAARMLGKSPRFTATAIAVIALGSGAVTTIFSAANAIILRRLPGVHEPSRLYDIARTTKSGGGSLSPSYPYFTQLQRESKTMSGVVAWSMQQLTISTGGEGISAESHVLADETGRRQHGSRQGSIAEWRALHRGRRRAARVPWRVPRDAARRLGAADDGKRGRAGARVGRARGNAARTDWDLDWARALVRRWAGDDEVSVRVESGGSADICVGADGTGVGHAGGDVSAGAAGGGGGSDGGVAV